MIGEETEGGVKGGSVAGFTAPLSGALKAGVQRTRGIRPAEARRVRGSELLKEGDGADRWGRVVSDRRERRGWQAVRWAVLGRGKKQAERELGRAGGKRRGRRPAAPWAEKKEKGRMG